MKNFRLLICVALTAVIALGLLFTPGTVRSDAYDSGSVDISGFTQFHDENAPRVTDRAGILSSSYESRITAEIAENSKLYRCDFVVLTVDGYSASEFGSDVQSYYGSSGPSFGDYLADYYDYNGYGIGDSFSGIIFGINMEEYNHEYWFITTGEAKGLFEDEITTLKYLVQPLLSDGRYEDAVDSYLEYCYDIARKAAATHKYQFGDRSRTSSDHVFDDAGILDAATKAEIEKALADVSNSNASDCILITAGTITPDVFGAECAAFYNERGSGYSADDYAADYFNYNGCGSGYDKSGVAIVFTKSGTDFTVGCFESGSAANFRFNKKGEAKTFIDTDSDKNKLKLVPEYLSLVFAMEKGKYQSSFTRFHGENLPRVIDSAGILPDAYEAKITKKLERLSKNRKQDVAILTVTNFSPADYGRETVVAANHGMYGRDYDLSNYADDYMIYNGYGQGDEYSGILLVISNNPSDRDFTIATSGKSATKLDSKISKLYSAISTRMALGNYEGAINKFIRYLRVRLALGHYPLSTGKYVFIGILASLFALIRASSVTKDRDPKITTVAGTHYIDGKAIRDKKEVFVKKSTTSVRHVDTSSSDGSRGGYSGGGHSYGSSGVSHGGGGGRF